MNSLEIIQAKIITNDKLLQNLTMWKFKEKKIVFTNGCFDIIHRGHIEYLSKAADYGDILIIGLNTDNSVKKIKGPNRPVQDETTRALVLASFSFVTNIVLFDEDIPYSLIKTVQPDVLIKGGDYKPEDIIGYDIVKAKGGSIEVIDFVKGYSTSDIIHKISEN